MVNEENNRMKVVNIEKYKKVVKKSKIDSIRAAILASGLLLSSILYGMSYVIHNEKKIIDLLPMLFITLASGLEFMDMASCISKKNIAQNKIDELKEENSKVK